MSLEDSFYSDEVYSFARNEFDLIEEGFLLNPSRARERVFKSNKELKYALDLLKSNDIGLNPVIEALNAGQALISKAIGEVPHVVNYISIKMNMGRMLHDHRSNIGHNDALLLLMEEMNRDNSSGLKTANGIFCYDLPLPFVNEDTPIIAEMKRQQMQQTIEAQLDEEIERRLVDIDPDPFQISADQEAGNLIWIHRLLVKKQIIRGRIQQQTIQANQHKLENNSIRFGTIRELDPHVQSYQPGIYISITKRGPPGFIPACYIQGIKLAQVNTFSPFYQTSMDINAPIENLQRPSPLEHYLNYHGFTLADTIKPYQRTFELLTNKFDPNVLRFNAHTETVTGFYVIKSDGVFTLYHLLDFQWRKDLDFVANLETAIKTPYCLKYTDPQLIISALGSQIPSKRPM